MEKEEIGKEELKEIFWSFSFWDQNGSKFSRWHNRLFWIVPTDLNVKEIRKCFPWHFLEGYTLGCGEYRPGIYQCLYFTRMTGEVEERGAVWAIFEIRPYCYYGDSTTWVEPPSGWIFFTQLLSEEWDEEKITEAWASVWKYWK